MAIPKNLNFDPDFFHKYATIDRYLSRGASGSVYGPIEWNDTQLAIKQVMFAESKVTEEFRKNLEVKKDIWTSLEHKHLTRIHSVDFSQLPKVMFSVMDFAAGGSLNKTLRSLGSENKLSIDIVTDWAKQIAEGMRYLHEKKIVHRDLKSANVLLMEHFDRRQSRTITLKISDFDEVKEHDHTTTMSLVGTGAYMAPEVLASQRFSKASDVWSFAVVIWEMLSGDIPHKDLQPAAIIANSVGGKLDNLPLEESFPDDFKVILNRCWELTCKQRPSFDELSCVLQQMAQCHDVIEPQKKKLRVSTNFPVTLKDESPEKYLSSAVLIVSTRTKAAEDKMKKIEGMTILDKELFVVSELSSEIEVYNSLTFKFSRRWDLVELFQPWDIGSCNIKKCIYILDYKKVGQSNEILRVDPRGPLIMNWSTGDDYGRGLSVTYESNIVLTVYSKNKLNEYSPDGQLIREINLLSEADIRYPLHALKLNSGHFVVSHGSGDDMHRVCLLDAHGRLLKSFGGKRGSAVGQMNLPVYVSVDVNGFVFVVDQLNRRVLLLNAELSLHREILYEKDNTLRDLKKIHVTDSNSRMIVADNYPNYGGKISRYYV